MYLTLKGTNKVFYYQKLNDNMIISFCWKYHKYRNVYNMELCTLKNYKAKARASATQVKI